MRRLIKWIKRMWHGPEPHYWILTVLDPVMNEKYVVDLLSQRGGSGKEIMELYDNRASFGISKYPGSNFETKSRT